METGINLERKIANISLEIQFLQNMTKPPLEQTKSFQHRLGDLSNLLKIRNSKYNHSQKTRESGQDWVRKKGVNIAPLV